MAFISRTHAAIVVGQPWHRSCLLLSRERDENRRAWKCRKCSCHKPGRKTKNLQDGFRLAITPINKGPNMVGDLQPWRWWLVKAVVGGSGSLTLRRVSDQAEGRQSKSTSGTGQEVNRPRKGSRPEVGQASSRCRWMPSTLNSLASAFGSFSAR